MTDKLGSDGEDTVFRLNLGYIGTRIVAEAKFELEHQDPDTDEVNDKEAVDELIECVQKLVKAIKLTEKEALSFIATNVLPWELNVPKDPRARGFHEIGTRFWSDASAKSSGLVSDGWAAGGAYYLIDLDRGPHAGKKIWLAQLNEDDLTYATRDNSDDFKFNFPEDEVDDDVVGGDYIPDLEGTYFSQFWVAFSEDDEPTKEEINHLLKETYGTTEFLNVAAQIISDSAYEGVANGNEPEIVAYAMSQVENSLRDWAKILDTPPEASQIELAGEPLDECPLCGQEIMIMDPDPEYNHDHARLCGGLNPGKPSDD